MEGPSLSTNIKETIERHFDGLIDDVTIREHRECRPIDRNMYEGFKPIYVADIGLSKEHQFCMIIELSYDKENKYMCFVSQLSECGTDKNPKNTTNIINALKHMLKELDKEGKARIGLSDVSHKEICGTHISLPVYYILRNGISWYNSLGFVSENFEQEKEHNAKIRKKTLEHYKDILGKDYDDLLGRHAMFAWFQRSYKDMTLAEFAKEIWDGRTNKCELIDVLRKLCNHIKTNELMYDTMLEYDEKYDVTKTRGGRSIRKKRSTKKRSTKKHFK